MEPELTVISLGAGRQSSALLALAANDMLPDDYGRVEAAIFADTGNEPAPVYEWLNVLESMASEAGIGFIVCKPEVPLGDHITEKTDKYKVAMAPFFTEGDGMLKRTCTDRYKIKPVRREIRSMLNRKSGKGANVDCLLGIAEDESYRIKPSGLDYINNRFPLVDMGWTTRDCVEFLEDQGYGTPPRSSCTFCPFRSDAEWVELRNEDYAGFLEAVDVDYALRAPSTRLGTVNSYLHRSLKPLESIEFDIRSKDSWQRMGECSGFCGV